VCEKKVDFKHSRSRGLAAGRRRDGLPCDRERILLIDSKEVVN